jgi:hypothetical protein
MQVKIVLRSTARSIACRFVVPGAWFFAPPVSCPTGFFKEETKKRQRVVQEFTWCNRLC